MNVLDPVKEYGCAPWPMVEKLIKRCLKENPQERPTSAQVLLWSNVSAFGTEHHIHAYMHTYVKSPHTQTQTHK